MSSRVDASSVAHCQCGWWRLCDDVVSRPAGRIFAVGVIRLDASSVGGADPMSDGQTGAWFVSQAAKDTFAQLKARWAQLDAWGVRSKVPKIREIVAIWDRFKVRWEDGDEDV